MVEDAITDEVADRNPFKGIRIRANDPRARKRRRPIRVFSFEQMHAFAEAAGRYEPIVRVFTDTGMRLGEILPLRHEDFDGTTLIVRRTAHEGSILDGTKTDHGEQDAGRVVPVPPTLAGMLEQQVPVNGADGDLLFPTPSGRMWRERNFYRDVWKPTQSATGLDIRPHECRHSFVTHLRATGVDDAESGGSGRAPCRTPCWPDTRILWVGASISSGEQLGEEGYRAVRVRYWEGWDAATAHRSRSTRL